ncbi:hypothetical protein [Aminobacter aminovorans]|uniref:hypothetical protein n=1 Tax=Aminobacter aminovorans TaxID=83263 RepID=UPI00285D6CEF|nr:hypothetical protein [Aminobacter aminovorans]MDR7223145.1 uncharacterized protein YjbI with pentapeptide repeats [Aminobacter aminovorans]
MKKDDFAPLEPWQRAENWQSLAIAAAIITPVLAAFCMPWIFAANGDASMLRRVQIVAAGVTVGFAAVTFFTVVWRGLISTQQAKLQREQLNRLAEQISETSKINLAGLLQNGAELLSESEKPAHVSAGLATLHAVASDTNDKFATQALNLMAEYVQMEGAASHSNAKVKVAIEYINSVFQETDRRTTLRLRFATEKRPVKWHLIEGTRYLYKGGTIPYQDLLKTSIEIGNRTFLDVRFQQCQIIGEPGVMFSGCEFVGCDILGISSFSLNRNHFERCDFSGADIRGLTRLPNLKERGNWYEPENPPRVRGRAFAAIDWADDLNVGRPARQGPVFRTERPTD